MWAIRPPAAGPLLPRRELEDELFGPDHSELVAGDAFDVRRIGAEGFDFALERGDLVYQIFVGFPELLNLGAEVPVTRKALLIEDQRRNRHDGHHHERERKNGGAGSHGAEPAATRGLRAIFRLPSQA